MDTIDTPQEIDRDRYGRPMVTPPEGGNKFVSYTRATTYVSALEDTYNLSRWQQRMVALGLASRPDLLLAVTAHGEDKKKLDTICTDALEAAKAHAAATTGTALHALTERIDRGQRIPVVPEEYRADLDAYRRATGCLQHLLIEQFTVLDDLKIGGTPDRVVTFGGQNYIADIKTGGLDFGLGKIAMQLAVYSRSQVYHHRTRKREPLPDVDQDRAIIIHLPAGKGQCELVWVDITAGWDAVQLATQVRGWRSRKNLTEPFTQPGADIGRLIEACLTVDQLTELYRVHFQAWTDIHTAAAKRRKAQLTRI